MFKEIEKAFGITLQFEKLENIKGLPFYMSANREFYKVSFENINFLIICVSADDKFGTIALKKQEMQYRQIMDLPVAYMFQNLTKVQRDALIRKKISFITLPDQIYLPFIGMMLRNPLKRKKDIITNKMMPATQSLFLYLLYRDKQEGILKKQAADDLKLTRTSITRASDQLREMKLIEEKRIGNAIYMKPMATGLELYHKAKPYLINPIQQILHVQYTKDLSQYPLAGESALACQSMLNEPKMREFALYKSNDLAKQLNLVDIQWENDKAAVSVQLWKYNPLLFAKNGMVDLVSLALSLQNVVDERIEGELEKLLEEYRW